MSKSVYFSPRGNMLLWHAEATKEPVITLENASKWYEIYMVSLEGVVQVPIELIEEISDKEGIQLWVDHLYHPRLLYRLAEHYKGYADPIAIEIATGRWLQEDGGPFNDSFYDPALTEEDDIIFVKPVVIKQNYEVGNDMAWRNAPFNPDSIKLLTRMHVLSLYAQADYLISFSESGNEWCIELTDVDAEFSHTRDASVLEVAIERGIENLEAYMKKEGIKYPPAVQS